MSILIFLCTFVKMGILIQYLHQEVQNSVFLARLYESPTHEAQGTHFE